MSTSASIDALPYTVTIAGDGTVEVVTIGTPGPPGDLGPVGPQGPPGAVLPMGVTADRWRIKAGDTAASWDRGDWLNVRDYGAVGDGLSDDTVPIAATFTQADAIKMAVFFPPGTYKTHTIDYRMQSVIGTSTENTTIVGFPGEDVFRVNATLGQFYRANGRFSDLTIKVDDTVDASASFPNRGGVGNACYANDYPDKAAASPPSAINWHFQRLRFTSTTGNPGAVGGLNKSCGIYTQSNHFTQNFMSVLEFSYLRYGWRDHYPVLNYTPYASGFSRDHTQVDFLHFLRNGYQWTTYGWGIGDVANIMFHGGPTIVDLDSDWNYMHIAGVEMVGNAPAQNWFQSTRSYKNTYEAFSISSNALIVWNENDSYYSGNFNNTTGLPQAQIVGSGNRFLLTLVNPTMANYGYGYVQDLGMGNVIESGRVINNYSYRRWSATADGRTGRKRDSHAPLLGYVDPPFISSDDLFINPRQLRLASGGPPAATGYDYIADPTADFGVFFRRVPLASQVTFDNNYLNDVDGFHVGNFLPAGKLRVYIRCKLAVAGTLSWFLQAPIGTTKGTIGNAPVGTAWTVVSFDADLTGILPSDTLRLQSGVPAGGGACPIDIAFIMFRPWAKDWLVESERVSADNGDAAKTLTDTDLRTQLWATPLTVARVVTLPTTNVTLGKRFRIVRTAASTGAFNLNVGTGPLKSLTAAGQWCEVENTGATWVLTAAGTL